MSGGAPFHHPIIPSFHASHSSYLFFFRLSCLVANSLVSQSVPSGLGSSQNGQGWVGLEEVQPQRLADDDGTWEPDQGW